ncbi:MAG TPA: tetratricopeptide repeat protein [Armatimonadota bacterium]|nr:tetratricopeptide repeat protein [Armatimonadota bacterium]
MSRYALLLSVAFVFALGGCGGKPSTLPGLEARVRSHPNSVQWRVALADAYYQRKMVHDAYVHYSRAVELDGTSYEAAIGLARVQYELGDYEKAMKAVKRAVAIKSDGADALALQGRTYLQLRDYARAVDRFEKAISIDPANAEAWESLPIAHVRAEHLPQAAEAARRAVKALPESVSARMNLGLVMALRGDMKGAEAQLRIARDLNPSDPEPPLRLAEMLVEQNKKLKEAYELALESAAIDPRDGSAYGVAAIALHKMRETNRAVLELKRHVQIHHQNLRLWLLLSALAQRNGDVETARIAAAMAIRIGPRPPDKMDAPTPEFQKLLDEQYY